MEIQRVEGGIDAFITPIVELLQSGDKYVDLATSLYPGFYNIVQIKKAITDCVKKVSRFRILIDQKADLETLRTEVPWIFELKNDYPHKIKVRQATKEITHCLLIDEKNFRIERYHREEEGGFYLKNLIIKKPPHVVAASVIQQFDLWWVDAEPVGSTDN